MEIKDLFKEIDTNARRIIDSLEVYQDKNVESLELPQHLFVDGAGFNGRNSKYCITVGMDGVNKDMPIVKVIEDNFTNNEMEYMAMIVGMIAIKNGGVLYSDSQLVVRQILNEYKCESKNLRLLNEIAKGLRIHKGLDVRWVKRQSNPAGKVLEKE